MIRERGLAVDIEVDGGVKLDNVAAVVEAGADVIVSGSGIFGTKTTPRPSPRCASTPPRGPPCTDPAARPRRPPFAARRSPPAAAARRPPPAAALAPSPRRPPARSLTALSGAPPRGIRAPPVSQTDL